MPPSSTPRLLLFLLFLALANLAQPKTLPTQSQHPSPPISVLSPPPPSPSPSPSSAPPLPRFLSQPLSGSAWTLTSANASIHANATVPGGAYLDLFHANLIPNPFYRFNENLTRWIAHTDWSYQTSFTLHPSLLHSPHLELVFDGIDTIADIHLDGHLLIQANDMFRRQVIDVTEALAGSEASHTLTVLVKSPVVYAQGLSELYPYTLPRSDGPSVHPMGERQFVRKSQVDWGWNNQPGFADLGIYRPVNLVGFYSAIIRDVVITQLHADRVSEAERVALSLQAGDVRLNVTSYLRIAPRPLSSAPLGVVTACVAGVCVNSSSIHLTAAADQSGDALLPVSVLLVIHSPALWWPQSLGNATLYPLTLTLTTTQVEHSLTRQIGFRSLTIIRAKDAAPGLTMHFHVNGQPMYLKGANFVPMDSFHARVTPSNLTRLLESAKASHLNILRVWGGGIMQLDEFYSKADELGLIIWQEMPFACALYPVWDSFLTGVREETAQIVRRLSTHASVLLYGGNNEDEEALTWFDESKANRDLYLLDYNRLYVDTIRDAVLREVGSSIEYLVSSPSNGPYSLDPYTQRWGDANDPTFDDIHVYFYDSDLSDPTTFPDARLVSETGFPSQSSYLATVSISLPSDRYPRSPLMLYRNRLAGVPGLADGLAILQAQMDRHFLPPNSTDDEQRFHAYLYLTQCVQALHYQTFIERYRRSQSGIDSVLHTQGTLLWMLNEGWPGGPSKAVLEWDARWKVTAYAVKRAYADVIVSGYSVPGQDRMGVAVVNDRMHGWRGEVVLEVRAWEDGRVMGLMRYEVTVGAQGATAVMESSVTQLLSSTHCANCTSCFVNLRAELAPMMEAGRVGQRVNVTLEGWIFLAPLKLVALPYPDLTVEVVESTEGATVEVQVVVRCAAPAAYVWLETPLAGLWSDGGFLLLPDAPRQMTFTSWEGAVTAKQLRANLSVLHTQATIARSGRKR